MEIIMVFVHHKSVPKGNSKVLITDFASIVILPLIIVLLVVALNSVINVLLAMC